MLDCRDEYQLRFLKYKSNKFTMPTAFGAVDRNLNSLMMKALGYGPGVRQVAQAYSPV